MKKCKRIILLTIVMALVHISYGQAPKRVILFMIDGMHWQVPVKLKMPVFNSLIKEGTYIEKSWMILPHDPRVGDYSKYNSCSFPNPVLHEGSIFIKPDNKYIQEVFPGKQTLFVVNSTAYQSVGRGFTTCIMDPTLSDSDVVMQAMSVLKTQDPVFTRIHLQTPGDMGTDVSIKTTPDQPFYRNIYGKGSPYVKSTEEADRLLGQFIAFLKKEGKWENTILIVTSDHGQSLIGWHPLFDEDSWMTPLVFVGPGIAKGRTLPYFEHIDLAPTIAWLLGANAPNPGSGSGKAVKEIMAGTNVSDYHPDMYIKTLNKQIKEYNILKSEMIIRAEKQRYFSNIIASLDNTNLTPEPFYDQDRIMDWYKAGTISHLLEANELILKQMRAELK